MYQFDPEALRAIMHDRHLGVNALASLLGVSKSCVSRVLAGQRKPGGHFLMALKAAFPTQPMEYFFRRNVPVREHGEGTLNA